MIEPKRNVAKIGTPFLGGQKYWNNVGNKRKNMNNNSL